MEPLVYIANMLYLVSYLTRDILHLRLLTISTACCLAIYFYCQPEPLMTVVGWNVFFVAMNAIQLGCLVRERCRSRQAGRSSPVPLRVPGAS